MLKKAHRDLAVAQRQLWKLQKEVSRGVTGVLVFLLHCLDYLAYVEEFYKTQITTAMQIIIIIIINLYFRLVVHTQHKLTSM